MPVPLTVAVLNLATPAPPAGLGSLVSEMLTTALASRKAFRLVERKRLEDLLGEMEFGERPVPGTLAGKIGSMTGADAVLTGSVAAVGAALRIDVRLVGARDGAVLAAASTQSGHSAKELARAVETLAGNLAAVLAGSGGPPFAFTLLAMSGDGTLRSVPANGVLRSGERYKIVFVPDRDCYVYIFQMDAAGQFFQLFPMESFRGVRVGQANPVRSGESYVLPGPGTAFVLDRQTGRERIYCVVSEGPNARLESLYADVSAAQADAKKARTQGRRAELERELATRGLAAVVDGDASPMSWESGGEVFSLVARRLSSACRECSHVIEFRHK